MNPLYSLVAQRAGNRCEYCRAPEAIFNFPFEVEYIIPSAQPGRDEDRNLALSCRACNVRKSNHLFGKDDITGADVRLFNPRQDRWQDHFRLEIETGAIQGTTSIGRVTVSRLLMNGAVQMQARLRWICLGLLP